jgi:Putative peptidoglycan binding domain
MGVSGRCECHGCHRLLPKPEAHRITVERVKGRSSGSFRFGRRSTSFMTGRTYYSQQDVWLCNSCYADYARKKTKTNQVGLVGAVIFLAVCIPILYVYQNRSTRPEVRDQTRLELPAASSQPPSPTANFVRVEDGAKQTPQPTKDVDQIQRRLIELGYLGGLADGVWGRKSQMAFRAFKAANGLSADDQWDDITRARLFSAKAVRAPLPVAGVR